MATAAAKEREEETMKRTFNALNDMRIKFPGKTDEEAEWVLSQVGLAAGSKLAATLHKCQPHSLWNASHLYIFIKLTRFRFSRDF